MATTGKRAAASANSGGASAFVNIVLVAVAVGLGIWLLVARGHVSWPPHRLLASLYTLAGCIALVGPLILLRSGQESNATGTTLWWFGGTLIWLHDLADAARGEFELSRWPHPFASQQLGLATLAVLIACWRTQGLGRAGSWTNILGWILGLFWIGVGLASLVPDWMPALPGSR